MGRKSRAKRDRREQTDFDTALIACEGTWLEQPISADEEARIAAARKVLSQHRDIANALSADQEATQRFSLEVFRDPRFAPLAFDDWMVESILQEFGEPPVAEDEGDTSFSDYLRQATQWAATSRVRRALVRQASRFLPSFVDEGKIRHALAIDYNSYVTVMSDAVTPLLAQMLVAALARWYDEHEEDEPA